MQCYYMTWDIELIRRLTASKLIGHPTWYSCMNASVDGKAAKMRGNRGVALQDSSPLRLWEAETVHRRMAERLEVKDLGRALLGQLR